MTIRVEDAGMGELRLVREVREGRELLFVASPTGEFVWASDPQTGQEWWYVSKGITDLRPQIEALVRPQPADAPPQDDLAGRVPGQSVLQVIERFHQAATTRAEPGEPGALEADVVPWCVGYVGEEQVGASLATLPAPWRVLHSVPVGRQGADVDHVVVGPAGIVTINSKHHPGGKVDVRGDAVFVGGGYQHYIRNARTEAEHARSAASASGVSAPLYAAVCVVGGRVALKEPADGVQVLPLPELIGWVLSLPRVLSDTEVVRLYAHLRHASSWGQSPQPPPPPEWVADLARGLATEHQLAKQAPARIRGAAWPADPGQAPSRRLPRSGPRRTRQSSKRSPARRRGRSTSWKVELVRGVAAIALVVAAVIWAKHVLPSVPSTPRPSPSTTAAAKLGQPCTTKGATTHAADGPVLVCRATGQKATLTWQRKT